MKSIVFACLLAAIVTGKSVSDWDESGKTEWNWDESGKSASSWDGSNSGMDCADPNQVYRYNVSTAPCSRPLCTTFQLPNNRRCENLAVSLYPIGDGCVCKPGYAQISIYECAKKYTCNCPAIANSTDTRFYKPIK